jgi:uncharacterized membrane protein YphA (DoxX/SURF4 family)
MSKLIRVGQLMFAAGITGLGVLCILFKDFIVGRPPAWPDGFEPNPDLVWISGVILIIAALFIVLRKQGFVAALIIAILIFLLSVLRHLPVFMDDWLNALKSLALLGGALIVAVSFPPEGGTAPYPLWNKKVILIGCILIGAFLIAAGYAHFKFVDFIANGFMPKYIPYARFWALFCGVCLCAGGLGIIIPQTRRIAALLSGIMVLGWFFLVHIPRFVANVHDRSDRLGLCESFLISGIFFVLSGMHPKGKPYGKNDSTAN